jgi:retron-type reverse transcriptase
MSLVQEVSALFHERASSWDSIMRPAASISWEDWESGSSNTRQIFRRIDTLASSILSISARYGIPAEIITKNAVAMASASQLKFARLTILTLLREGVLTGSEDEWMSALPQPSAVTLFLSRIITGNFAPTAAAFADALPFAESHAKGNCIRNLLLSISPFPNSAHVLLTEIKDLDFLSKASPEKFVAEIKARIGEGTFVADIDVPILLTLPQDWRRSILGHGGLSRLFLTPASIQTIAAAPQSIPDTPASILGSTLKTELARELERASLSGKMIEKIFEHRSAAEVLEKEFDWSVLVKLDRRVQLEEKTGPVPRFYDFLHRTSEGRLAGNLLAIVISAAPPGPSPRLDAEAETARQILEAADTDVLSFAVKSSRSTSQAFLVKSLLHKTLGLRSHKLAVDAFFSGSLDKDVDLPTLNALLPLASIAQRNTAFKAVLELDSICEELLLRSEDYRKFYADHLKRGELPKYCASISLFRIYGKLGETGAEIVEALLKHRAKIPGKPSPKALLELLVSHAPALAGFVFERRGISSSTFTQIVDSESFREYPPSAQVSILSLKSRRGKPALRLAFRSISRATLEWLGGQDRFRNLVAIEAPGVLTPEDVSLPELLVGTTIRPGEAKTTLAGIDRVRLLNALPEALLLLKEKPRISAALELAIRSEIAALPVFMRLAKRLAPPFEKSQYGKRFDDLYTTHELPKRSGGKRIISAPAVHLKVAQRALLALLYAEGFSDQAMGFVPGRSIKDNAAKHVGQNIVVNADVKGFFPSTSYRRVYSLSRRLCDGSLSPLAARLFSEICCHDGHLATGAPTSPAVSNLIMRDLDASLGRIATKLDVTYTRYADDLTFSGQDSAVWMLKPLKTHLAKLGYELDPKKTNIFRKGRRQVVTGAVVNQRVNLARPLRKLLRAAVDHRVKGKQPFFQGKPMSDAALNGYLSYLRMLSPESAAPLISKLRESPEWKY